MKSMYKTQLSLILTVLTLLCTGNLMAQNREYIRNAIRDWGECRNVAITKTNGDLALYGINGSARKGCPQGLDDALEELNDENEYIKDVQLTEEGSWLILYGENGMKWSNIPSSLEQKLEKYNNNGEDISSVTFNDSGEWIVITDKHYACSDSDFTDWLTEGSERYGELWTACITDDALVAVFEKGYKYLGEVPESLKEALEETQLNVYRLKISGDAWFFADKDGNYKYDM